MATVTSMRSSLPLEGAVTPAELQDRLSQAVQEQRAALLNFQANAVAARATAPVSSATAVVVSPDDFTRALSGMQVHYAQAIAAVPLHGGEAGRPAAPDLFKLSAALAFRPVLKSVTATGNNTEPPPPPHIVVRPGDAAVDGFVADIHSASLALIQQHSNALVSAAKNAQARNLATAAWLQQMEASRAAMKASADAQLKVIFDKATAVGNVHPEQRARILAAANQGSSLIHALLAGMTGVTTTIGHVAGGVAHVVTTTVSAVGSWAAGAVKSVGSFFSHLF